MKDCRWTSGSLLNWSIEVLWGSGNTGSAIQEGRRLAVSGKEGWRLMIPKLANWEAGQGAGSRLAGWESGLLLTGRNAEAGLVVKHSANPSSNFTSQGLKKLARVPVTKLCPSALYWHESPP